MNIENVIGMRVSFHPRRIESLYTCSLEAYLSNSVLFTKLFLTLHIGYFSAQLGMWLLSQNTVIFNSPKNTGKKKVNPLSYFAVMVRFITKVVTCRI